MTRKELAEKITEKCYKVGKFHLVSVSGLVSDYYWDKFGMLTDPIMLSEIASRIIYSKGFMSNPKMERVAGMELGGALMATAISLQEKIPSIIVRKEAKKYGTENSIECSEVTGGYTILVEDIVTTGKSIIKAINILRKNNFIVTDIYCLIDRDAGGKYLINSHYSDIYYNYIFKTNKDKGHLIV